MIMGIKPELVNQHKRLAMGNTVKGYARGGRVGSAIKSVSIKPGVGTVNPLKGAKMTDSIPDVDLKAGGPVKSKKC
jgi:hypothetical protein